MNIPQRIQTIGNFINEGEVVADVGADHGLLELYLVSKYDNIDILAIENKKGPYSILKGNLKSLKNVTILLSDGISSIKDTTNTIVLAGMGGLNIKKILKAHPKKAERVQKFILDAHRDLDIARETIIKYGFKIANEKIVFEQEKFYVITVFEKCEKAPEYSKDEIQFGYKIYEDELWPKYKQYLINQNNKTIASIGDNYLLQDKVLRLKNINERLENYGKN